MNYSSVPTTARHRWIEFLDEEDVAFLKRFVLASGSLKATAQAYGVSYPTVRLRLDRLIERVKIYDDATLSGEFERVARGLFAEGRLDVDALKVLLEAHRHEVRESS